MLTSSCEMISVIKIIHICQRCKPSSGSDRNVRNVSFCAEREASVPRGHRNCGHPRTWATRARVTPMAVRCTCERVIWWRSAGDMRSSVMRCSQARFQCFVVRRAVFITLSPSSAAASCGQAAACASIHSRPASTIVLRAARERTDDTRNANKVRTARREHTNRRRPTPNTR